MNENAESVKERPILFSGPMVRAILNGQKHVTRRPVKGNIDCQNMAFHELETYQHDCPLAARAFFREKAAPGMLHGIFCPFGAPGDRLWVRETWAPNVPGCETQGGYSYRADHHNASGDGPVRIKWRPSIHMPRVASRLTLTISSIAVERVQDMTDKDAWDEGIDALDGYFDDADLCATAKKHGLMVEDAIATFAHMWDTTYAARGLGWTDNPYVWVVRFRPLEAA